MKHIKFLLGLVVLTAALSFACSKSDSPSPDPITVDQLVGDYTWVSSSAGSQPASISRISESSVLAEVMDLGSMRRKLTCNLTDGKIIIPSQVYNDETFSGTATISGNILTFSLDAVGSSASWKETIILTKVQ